MEVGERIRKLRKERHLSQVKLAEMAGISQSALSDIESTKVTKKPNVETVKRLAEALNIPTSRLLGESSIQINTNLSEIEWRLIAAWRASDEIGREDALALLERHAIKGKEVAAS